MSSSKLYVVGALIIIGLVVGVWYKYWGNQNAVMRNFAAGGPVAIATNDVASDDILVTQHLPPHYCPQRESLIKKGDYWMTADDKWQSYTPSSATKILNFFEVQWIGIKVGKVICLYKTSESIDFPIELEQVRSQLILEPKTNNWSALVGNRRFCKSASVADCVYFVKPAKNIKDVYKEIKYNPARDT